MAAELILVVEVELAVRFLRRPHLAARSLLAPEPDVNTRTLL